MRVPPRDVDEAALAALVGRAWGLAVRRLEHLPVGFGSHHWAALTTQGERYFVTVDLLDPRDPDAHAAALEAAFTTALVLGEGQLPQAVAPLRTAEGGAVARGASYSVTVQPQVHGREPAEEELRTEPWRGRRLELLARLHDATPAVRHLARPDDLQVQARSDLERALASLGRRWDTGPYGEGARELVRARADDLAHALTAYDARSALVREGRPGWVVTHGEPHAQNLLVRGEELLLVDWDTVRIGPPARDLWMVDSGDGEVGEYVARTGRAVPAEELELYRVHWELSEIALYTADFARPHEADADTAIAWRGLSGYLSGGSWAALA